MSSPGKSSVIIEITVTPALSTRDYIPIATWLEWSLWRFVRVKDVSVKKELVIYSLPKDHIPARNAGR